MGGARPPPSGSLAVEAFRRDQREEPVEALGLQGAPSGAREAVSRRWNPSARTWKQVL